MSRCSGRLARWTLRGALLVGGVVGLWGFHEAGAGAPAQAAEPAASCALGNLLSAGGVLFDGSLECQPISLAGPAAEGASARVGSEVTVARRGQVAGLDVAVRMPTGERPAGVQVAVGEVVDSTVVGIIGSSAAPSMPPADAAVNPAPYTNEAPAAATPTVIVRPLPPMAALHPVAAARTSLTASLDPRSAKADGTSGVQGVGDLLHALGPTRGAPGSAAGHGCAADGTGIPADASEGSWAPAVRLVGAYVSGCEKLAGCSGQPDTGPA